MNDALSTIDPDDLVGYLSSRGWRHEGSWRGAMVWRLDAMGEVLVPARREYPDDDELLEAAVRKLARCEERPEREVLLDIAEPAIDTPSFRLESEAPSGTIPLPSAVKAVQGIHDLLKIAAQTVESGPRLLFTGQRSRYVDNFLHGVRLGTTRPGSYIFDARVPITQPPSRSRAISWNDELAGRDVMIGLYKALHAAADAATAGAERHDPTDAFDDHLQDGVSANLCTALSELSGNRPFTVSFTWARAEPVDVTSHSVGFSAPMLRILGAAGKDLERLAKSGHATVIGEVETLQHAPGEQPRVKIRGEFRSRSNVFRRSIWVVLDPADYQRAFHAQIQKRRLRASGELDPNQGRLELRPDPGGFEVL
ncbi:hypothetical protein [Microbispora sp. H10670]|uniref:hypothetical protein n=1 Tax=Microbispora sp. H10670 TaxID=2729108 RepID=UPI0016032A3B|nr:hypothetical protein [Microbispora sp. H10670]